MTVANLMERPKYAKYFHLERHSLENALLLFLYLVYTSRAVLHPRVKIHKAYILHDQGQDEAAWREAEEAETMLISPFEEYAEDKGILHNIKANILLSRGKNDEADRERIIDHLNRCIHYCERATVDGSVSIVQATLRMALAHLGYYQHGILEDVPGADVRIAESILKHVSKSEPLSERSKVYYTYGQSLLAYRKGNKKKAAELEDKVRGNCQPYKLSSELQQLDMLKTLILGQPAFGPKQKKGGDAKSQHESPSNGIYI